MREKRQLGFPMEQLHELCFGGQFDSGNKMEGLMGWMRLEAYCAVGSGGQGMRGWSLRGGARGEGLQGRNLWGRGLWPLAILGRKAGLFIVLDAVLNTPVQ